MIEVIESGVVRRPMDEVYAYVSDFGNMEAHDPAMREVESLTLGPVDVGSRYRSTVRFLGLNRRMIFEIVELDPPHKVVFRGEDATSVVHDVVRLQPEGSNTRVTWTVRMELRGVARLGAPVVWWALRRVSAELVRRVVRTLDGEG